MHTLHETKCTLSSKQEKQTQIKHTNREREIRKKNKKGWGERMHTLHETERIG